MLEDKRSTGECAIPARSLNILLEAPQPYGIQNSFEEKIGTFKVVTYKGDFNNGFIAKHQGDVFGLQANVYDPGEGLVEYYLWDNHKVVFAQYLEEICYLDPSYGKVYNKLDEMAEVQITKSYKTYNIKRIVQTHLGEIVFTPELCVATRLSQVGIYFCCYLWEGRLLSSESEIESFPNCETIWIGPFIDAEMDFSKDYLKYMDIKFKK